MTEIIEIGSCGCSLAKESISKCPVCSKEGTRVSDLTLQSQLKENIYFNVKSNKNSFNFCESSSCNAVYYSDETNEVLYENQLKNKVASKNKDLDTPLCYCKGITKAAVLEMIEENEENLVERLNELLYTQGCLCEQTNPRGVSCIKDITEFLSVYGIDYETGKKIETKEACCSKEEAIMRQFTSSCCPTIRFEEDNRCGC